MQTINMISSPLKSKIAEMQRLFDESFALALPDQVTAPEPMLAITLESEPFALRVHEIIGVALNKEKIVSVPSRVPELLGLTGIRGVIVPVFSLARLLGFDSEHCQAYWLVLCGERQSPIVLAFEGLEQQFEVASTEIFAHEDAPGHRYVSGTVCEGGTLRSVIDIPSLVEYIKARGTNKPRSKR